jgi:hypothetical protein
MKLNPLFALSLRNEFPQVRKVDHGIILEPVDP